MRKIMIDLIKGNEKLAEDILSVSGIVLMSKGTIIKKDYIVRLKELNIEYLWVEDEIGKGVKEDELIEVQIRKECQDTVKKILDKYSFKGNDELEELAVVADRIILDILEEPEIMFNITGVRNKSESIYSHSINVCTLSVLIALKMKLPKNKIKEIAVGSLLHDIGYRYMAMDINTLDIDGMTEIEIKELKKHVIYGYSAVEKEEWISSVAKDIILSHHERIDGTGYPFHINDERIKIGSKIVSVCDEFDCKVYGMYEKKMKVHEVIDYIMSRSGVKFDFNVVKVFYESVAAYPTGSTVITNTGETALVLRQNKKCPTRPVIRIIKDKAGKYYEEWKESDLTKNLTLFISDTIDE